MAIVPPIGRSQLSKIRNSDRVARTCHSPLSRGGAVEQQISAAPRMTNIEDGTSRYVLGIINEFGTKRISPVSIRDSQLLS